MSEEILSRLIDELNAVAKVLQASAIDPRRANEVYGWNIAAASKQQLADIATDLAEKVRGELSQELDEQDSRKVSEAINSLTSLRNNSMANFASSPAAGLPGYLDTMTLISFTLDSVFHWQKNTDPKFQPKYISRRLSNQVQKLDQLDAEFELLDSKVRAINEASETADALPATLKELNDAQTVTASLANKSLEDRTAVANLLTEANDLLLQLRHQASDASLLVKKSEEAFRITTSAGLAGSFHVQAKNLNRSVIAAITVLVMALGSAVWINHERLDALKSLLEANSSGQRVAIQLAVLLVGLGAPVWLAWLATKQITQRFKLAEDYAFKAAIAKAYEGYRKEAVTLDPKFAETLFESAMKRFDEHPLRFVDKTNPGSPLADLRNAKLLDLDKLKDAVGLLKRDRGPAESGE
jgi:chemotaxis protein CheY-P-specific phosphatase CheC